MLIDWLTLRTPISDIQESDLLELLPYMAKVEVRSALNDELLKSKLVIDIDSVRSDFQGMVWSITSNGKEKFLNIGASPAFLEFGRNIFGSLNYQHCKKVLIDYAKRVLPSVLLFSSEWLPRRIDITQNYSMQSHYQVKEALHILRSCDGTRQKATTRSDSVYWGAGSSYRQGKAYDKYTQSIELNRIASKLNKSALYDQNELDLLRPIIRLEMSLGRQFFDEHLKKLVHDEKTGFKKYQGESFITEQFLINQHNDFFGQFIGLGEVTDMDELMQKLKDIAPSDGLARSSYDTYLRIKSNGYEFTKASMSKASFFRHTRYLKLAGLTQSDLTSAMIVPLKKRRIDLNPVDTWQQLQERKAA